MEEGLDRQGRFWAWLYDRGYRMANRRGLDSPKFPRLVEYAKRHPIPGSIAQGLAFGLLFSPVLLVFLLGGASGKSIVILDSLCALFFGTAMYGYNRYVRRQGEPWVERPQAPIPGPAPACGDDGPAARLPALCADADERAPDRP